MRPDHLVIDPPVPIKAYRDGFGDSCSRLSPRREMRLGTDTVVNDPGTPDQLTAAYSTRLTICPRTPSCSCWGAAIARLTASRRRPGIFRQPPTGWGRVQAICDYVHQTLILDTTRSSDEDRMGNLQRAPGRVPGFRPPGGDLLPLCEHPGAVLHRLSRRHRSTGKRRADGFQRLVRSVHRGTVVHVRRRHNFPRIGRVFIARTRRSDVAISTTFGPNTLTSFRVWTDEVKG